MLFYSFNFVVLIASAIFFYQAGEFDENSSGLLWASLSLLISILTWLWFGWGLLWMIISQVGLFISIGIIRTFIKL
jgi:hypothetical protein